MQIIIVARHSYFYFVSYNKLGMMNNILFYQKSTGISKRKTEILFHLFRISFKYFKLSLKRSTPGPLNIKVNSKRTFFPRNKQQ